MSFISGTVKRDADDIVNNQGKIIALFIHGKI